MKAFLASLLGLSLALPAAAQDPPIAPIQEEGDFYVLNFSENPESQLNLLDFVKLCQEATGRNFTPGPGTDDLLSQANVVMFGPKRIPKEDFYQFFQIQMFINDFVCVEVGPPHISLILIQSLQGGPRSTTNIKQRSTYVLPEDLPDYEDQPATLITTVITLKNIDTRQLTTSLRGLLTDTNTQTLLSAGDRSVILQGFGSYIASLAQLLKIVDEESAIADDVQPVFDVIPLEFAAPEDVAALIEELLEAQNSARNLNNRNRQVGGEGVAGTLRGNEVEAKILVDARTNSLLVMAMPEEMPRIMDLVARLDVDVPDPERNFHIYPLQNVRAEELADVLEEFLSDAERVTGTTQGGTGGQVPGTGGGGTSSRTSNEVIVVPDNNSNALLIAANKTRYEEVVELIRQLDRRQDQVLIESALIELTGSDLLDIGFEWAFADVSEDGGFGATNFGLSQLTDTDNDGAPDTRIPLLNNGVTAGILSGDDVNLPFLVAAAQNREDTNVLNIPSVLVNNNGSARVVTLDEQPTTTVTATGAAGTTQENFDQYQEAGITLEISPSISASRYLRLQISLVVSNFTGQFGGSTIPPPRITREMFTTVNVPDGDTMVIGGVVSDILRDTDDQVPFLGDIPLLGNLFKRKTKSNDRTTLYFFVTPHILRDRDFADLAEISYQKKLRASEIIGPDRVRLIDEDFGESDGTIDFDRFQVPLYRSPQRGELNPDEVGLDPLQVEELLRDAEGGE